MSTSMKEARSFTISTAVGEIIVSADTGQEGIQVTVPLTMMTLSSRNADAFAEALYQVANFMKEHE